MTLLEVLQSTTGYFHRHNIESPRLNAEHLLAYVLGRKRIELYLEFERKLPESESLVELLLSNFKSEIANGRIADVGTGSGVIALTLAVELPCAEIVAAD